MPSTNKVLDAEWLAEILESQLFVRIGRYGPDGATFTIATVVNAHCRNGDEWWIAMNDQELSSDGPRVTNLGPYTEEEYRRRLTMLVNEWQSQWRGNGWLERQATLCFVDGVQMLHPTMLFLLGRMHEQFAGERSNPASTRAAERLWSLAAAWGRALNDALNSTR